jgi:hypothetical protein
MFKIAQFGKKLMRQAVWLCPRAKITNNKGKLVVQDDIEEGTVKLNQSGS